MRHKLGWLVFVSAAAGLLAGCGVPPSPEAQDSLRLWKEKRERATWVLRMARERGQELLKAGREREAAELYEKMTREAIHDAREQSDASYLLGQALELAVAAPNPKAKIAFLDNAFGPAIQTLKFTPIMESGLPSEYPPPSVPGLIRTKRYPSSRIAWVGGSWQDRLFASLFERDREGPLAVTIPVEFTLIDGELVKKEHGLFSMSEHYRSQEAERRTSTRPIASRNVDKPILVVSVAVKGPYSAGNMAEPLAKLREWLQQHPEYEQVDHPRLLAYNTPLVWWWMKYGEVQIPIREKR